MIYTNKKGLLTVVCAAAAAAILAFCGTAEARTLKIGHILAPGSNQNQALEKVFKPYVEEKSGGELKIRVFPNEQLGHAPDMVEGVKLGHQDMFLGSQTWFASHVEEIGVATIPFIFEDRDHLHRWVDEVLAKDLQEQLIKKGNQRFINLETKWHRGPFRVICSSKKPVLTPDDVKGLKLRLWPAKMIQKSWAGLGAEVHTIDFAESYLALSQGVVDAITSPFDLVFPQKFSEVAKYITELRQFPQLELITINEDVWNALSPEHRQILLDAAAEAGRWYNEQAQTRVEETIENKLLKVHNAVYIRVKRQPFVDAFRKDVLPGLIKDGHAKREWVDKVEQVK